MPARVLIVEDHPLVRLGLSHSLAQHPRLEKCGEADGELEAMQLIEEEEPDAVIVDLTLRNGAGLGLIKRLRQSRRRLAIVVSSMHDPCVYEHRSLQAGADAYVSKDRGVDDLMQAVDAALLTPAQESPPANDSQLLADKVRNDTTDKLTDRELEIFRLIGRGLSTRQIATTLHRSPKTIEAFRVKLKKKLQLSSSEELVRDAVRWVYENDAA